VTTPVFRSLSPLKPLLPAIEQPPRT